MPKINSKHMQIIHHSSFVEDLEKCFYSNSNEKELLREKLKFILKGFHTETAIDLGAGPGLVADVLQQHTKNLTLVDISKDYETILKTKFPNAKVSIESIFNFNFEHEYDLILFSHVLYYIDVEEWLPFLKKLRKNLKKGGKLIITHAPCHHIHKLFQTLDPQLIHIAYLNEIAITKLMNEVGSYSYDNYVSSTCYDQKPTLPFAKQLIKSLFGIKDESVLDDFPEQLNEVTKLFKEIDGKYYLEYYSDIYVFTA